MIENFRANRHLILAEGIVFLILGALAIALPAVFTTAVTLLFGIILLIAGVFVAVRIANMRSYSGKWADWLFAIALLATGILLIISPEKGALTLTAMLIAFFTVGGVAKVLVSLFTRDLPNWGWILVSGLISLALAAVIISGWPGTALWSLGLLLGVNLFVTGFALTTVALSLKKIEQR
ncbi:MAG: HdeD family acid-resistance protein [Parachlamydia sp.]|nr:HdeD family acid-resistance protein [Parachlamydia sp.]